MKYLYCIILSVLAFAFSAHALEPPKHLFILSGQSNMARLDPSISFTPTVEAAFGKDQVVVVKDAQGGQPIRRWYKQWKPATGHKLKAKGDLYDRLLQQVKKAGSAAAFDSVTFIWMQGERDAREKHGDVYAASLTGLLAQLSEDLGRTDINFVIGRLSDFDMADQNFPHWTMVRKAQVEFAESYPGGAWVDTDDLNDGLNDAGQTVQDDLHCSVEGYIILGKRFAEASIELIKERF